MNRLLQGDVGSGKTVIAALALGMAVQAGKQAALMAPTSILAEQHYETFQERFDGYPVSIQMLSRFVKPKQQKRVLTSVADGAADIVIGTHRLMTEEELRAKLGDAVRDRYRIVHREDGRWDGRERSEGPAPQ